MAFPDCRWLPLLSQLRFSGNTSVVVELVEVAEDTEVAVVAGVVAGPAAALAEKVEAELAAVEPAAG